jgi:uncharacterized RDD family membrane protein YckC
MGTAAAMIAVRHLLGPAKKTADRYFSPRLASPPGGLWRRLIAFALDLVVCGVAVYFADIILKPLAGGTESIPLVVALAFIFLWLYFACFESSTIQATLGKRALGVFVTDEEGQRVSFGRASARHFGKILSSPFALGFLMAAFTEDHQTVHDLISRCVVVKK